MNLAIITPTRRRWKALEEQAIRLAPQLGVEDRWIIVIDQDHSPSSQVVERFNQLIGIERLVWCLLCYQRSDPPVACVNRARNVGAALAPPGYALVELDDHDLIDKYALSEIRHALEAGADYVFGGYKQRALFPTAGGKVLIEIWPDITRSYSPGGFARDEMGADAIGLRAIRRELWDKLGGWRLDVWPCADKDFARRAERAGASIVCLELPLCTVTIEGDSLSAEYRGRNPVAEFAG